MTQWGSEEGEEEFTCPFSDLAQFHIVVFWWLEEKYNEKKKNTQNPTPLYPPRTSDEEKDLAEHESTLRWVWGDKAS